MHRDIKTENVMFTDSMMPVLIDFGLAKIIDEHGRYGKTHTGDCGTAGYMAPEVYKKEPYGCPADVWSVGIVLLEMFTGELKCERDKAAFQKVKTLKAQLPDKPVPNLIRQLLEEDPAIRISAHDALSLPLFTEGKVKFAKPERRKFIAHAAPTATGGASKRGKSGGNKKKGGNFAPAMCQKICRVFEVKNDFVPIAAWAYFNAAYGSDAAKARIAAAAAAADEEGEQYEELDEQMQWVICVILAIKIYEAENIDIEECDEEFPEICADFDTDRYMEEEMVILKAMDYCLFLPYPEVEEDGKKAKKKSRKK
jgi:hypothetical protein